MNTKFLVTRRSMLYGFGSLAATQAVLLAHPAAAAAIPNRSIDSHQINGSKPGQSTVVFTKLSSMRFNKSTSEIITGGWSFIGLGGGRYVSDALARELATSHPRFCTATLNGQYYRLVPSDGMITVEQAGALGNPLGEGAINDRGPFQAAINYARAIGIEIVGLTQGSYSIWVSERVSDPILMADDGQGLVIAADQRVHFVGLATAISKVRFYTSTGRSFDGSEAGANFQIVIGQLWRGCGFLIRTHNNAADSRRSGITLQRLCIDGGSRRNLSTTNPDDLNWDITNKGICVEPNRLGGDITILDSVMTGWRGETVYCSNDTTTKLAVRNSTFSDSNGQGLNPNGCHVDVENCEIRNCFMGIEGWTGALGGRIVSTTIADCRGLNGTGSAVTLQGGMYGRSARSDYYAPTEVKVGEVPIGIIDIVCKRSARAFFGWWLSGQLTLIDTFAIFGEPMAHNEGAQFVDLNITLTNESSDIAGILLTGGSGQAGDMLTNNCTLRIAVHDMPQATSVSSQSPVMWYGSLGDNIFVTLTGADARPLSRVIGPLPDFSPHFA